MTELKDEDWFWKSTGKVPGDEKIVGTGKFIQELTLETSKDLAMVHCKSHKIFLADALLKFQKTSIETCSLDRSYSVFSPGFAYECNLNESKHFVENIRDKELYLPNRNSLRRGLIIRHSRS